MSSPGLPTSPIAVTLAEMLAIVAPTSMSIDQQTVFLQAALKALDSLGINAEEVAAVAPQVIAKVVRHQQIVHEISDAVHEKRARKFSPPGAKASPRYWIDAEAQIRRGQARTKEEIEDAFQWERNRLIEAGLHVEPLQPPLTRHELDDMPAATASLGIKYGYLRRVDGKLVEVTQ